ncbi:MAG: hypothetical protein M3Q18_08165 [Actinomycetota bacterium]|nr:hypothetical protein [Actinomycetota bacterium]
MSVSDERLEAELRDLGPVLSWPEPKDVAPEVSQRLRAGRPGWSSGKWTLVAAALVLLLAAGSLSALPNVRRAVADWLGLPGVRVERVESGQDLPSPAVTPELGSRVSLAEAAAAVPFDLVEPPRIRGLEIYLDGEAVTFVRRAPSGDIELLITQFEGKLDRELVEKVLPPGSRLRSVVIGGRQGYWIAGDPHTVLYVDPFGEIRENTVRLAGNTLLWQRGRLTLRLEVGADLRRALLIARSLK